jgi:hypothetical protein
MKIKLTQIIRTKPLFLYLLPVFFVWHGYVEFYNLIPFSEVITLILSYLTGTLVVFLVLWLIYKNISKASLLGFFIMCLYFFFGSFQDFLVSKFSVSFITRYSFILPAFLIIFILLFIYIKRQKKSLVKTAIYLNVVLFVLIFGDTISFITKVLSNHNIVTAGKYPTLIHCNTCPKPDIYLIIADGYSGTIPLRHFFNYDNSSFENQLRQKGFYVADSTMANYNSTLFSMGSLLNMAYLKLSKNYHSKNDIPIGFKSIKNNILMKYLQSEKYDIYNYSIFDIERHAKRAENIFLNFETTPITTQTFLYRLYKDLGYHLILDLKLKFLQKQDKKNKQNNINQKLFSLTKEIVSIKSVNRRFVYTHLVMPHNPYYFDSLGNRVPDKVLTNEFNNDRNAYLGYLKYTNKKILELIDYIQSNTSKGAIIILMSDHGFRETDNENYLKNSQLLNLNAVFFPDRNYTGFYRGMSNVNEFRVVLNSQFGQHLSLLKDSTIIIK